MPSTILQSPLPITISHSDSPSHGVILVKNHLRANIIIPRAKTQNTYLTEEKEPGRFKTQAGKKLPRKYKFSNLPNRHR